MQCDRHHRAVHLQESGVHGFPWLGDVEGLAHGEARRDASRPDFRRLARDAMLMERRAARAIGGLRAATRLMARNS